MVLPCSFTHIDQQQNGIQDRVGTHRTIPWSLNDTCTSLPVGRSTVFLVEEYTKTWPTLGHMTITFTALTFSQNHS